MIMTNETKKLTPSKLRKLLDFMRENKIKKYKGDWHGQHIEMEVSFVDDPQVYIEPEPDTQNIFQDVDNDTAEKRIIKDFERELF